MCKLYTGTSITIIKHSLRVSFLPLPNQQKGLDGK